MHTYKQRLKENLIQKYLKAFPAAALLGARQVEKAPENTPSHPSSQNE